jgi:ferredoxin
MTHPVDQRIGKAGPMEVWVDHGRCHGHGVCDGSAPDFFTFDDSGYNVAPRQAVPAAMTDQVRAAVASCPERAIHTNESAKDSTP